MPEFDKGVDAPILDCMSIQAVDLRKLVKIVRQYEVIYGGGISSSDAAIREECESLVGLLESELGGKGRSSPASRAIAASRAADKLPSLVDAKKKLKDSGFPRPTTARITEIIKLGSPKRAETPSGKAPASSGTGTAPSSKRAAVVKAAKAGSKRAGKLEAKEAKPAPQKRAVLKSQAAKGKIADAAIARAKRPSVAEEDPVYKDVRSRYAGAAKSAEERARKITGSADASGEVETKHSFAALHLFDAFKRNRLPKYGGFIVCIRFTQETGYTVFEIIGYQNMQDIYPDGDTLIFKSVGCKLYAIVEPSGYLLKSVEPPNRPSEQMIPYRFSELLRITTKRFQNVLIGRKPVFMPTSFSVFKPSGDDLAVLFYDQADVYANIQDFLIMIMRDRLGLPIPDSRKAAEAIAKGIREFRLWMDEA